MCIDRHDGTKHLEGCEYPDSSFEEYATFFALQQQVLGRVSKTKALITQSCNPCRHMEHSRLQAFSSAAEMPRAGEKVGCQCDQDSGVEDCLAKLGLNQSSRTPLQMPLPPVLVSQKGQGGFPYKLPIPSTSSCNCQPNGKHELPAYDTRSSCSPYSYSKGLSNAFYIINHLQRTNFFT